MTKTTKETIKDFDKIYLELKDRGCDITEREWNRIERFHLKALTDQRKSDLYEIIGFVVGFIDWDEDFTKHKVNKTVTKIHNHLVALKDKSK